jgi:hypothetical protein
MPLCHARHVILRFVADHGVDVVVMGTVERKLLRLPASD